MQTQELAELYRFVAVWGIGVVGILITAIATIFNSRINQLAGKLEHAVSKEQFNHIANRLEHAVMKDAFEDKMADLDEQRRNFYADTIRRLDEIAAASRTLATQAVELGRLDVRVEQLEEENLPRRVAALEARIKHAPV